ncbi:hypothetical protein RDABS01_007719 [Bienertia sinuspersici]
MLEIEPLIDAMDGNGPQEEMDFIVDLIEGIEEGETYPYRFYESGDLKRQMSHEAFNALGIVLHGLDDSDPCYRKYKENLRAEKARESLKEADELHRKMKGKEKVVEVKQEVVEEVVDTDLKKKGVVDLDWKNKVAEEKRVVVCGLPANPDPYVPRCRVPKPAPAKSRVQPPRKKRCGWVNHHRRTFGVGAKLSVVEEEEEVEVKPEPSCVAAESESSLEMWVEEERSAIESLISLNCTTL